MILHPLEEIGLSLAAGMVLALVFSILARQLKQSSDVLILLFGFILISAGVCIHFHLSVILTNMVIGMVIINTQSHQLVQNVHDRLSVFLPLLFILFFTRLLNLIWGIFNILPIFPLDGGRILFHALARGMRTERALINTAYVSLGFSILAGLYCLQQGYFIFLIFIFLFFMQNLEIIRTYRD